MPRITAHILGQSITSNSKEAYNLYEKSYFGEKVGDKVKYSPSEILFLVERTKAEIFAGKKKLTKTELTNKLRRIDKKISLKYPVFKELRKKGYVLKTALKFGADFRIYEKSRYKQSHAKWILFVEHESKKISLHEFAAKNRVAHSTRKNLLLAIVDEEDKVTYYEVGWIKP